MASHESVGEGVLAEHPELDKRLDMHVHAALGVELGGAGELGLCPLAISVSKEGVEQSPLPTGTKQPISEAQLWLGQCRPKGRT
jgi:hypothetical protein